MGTMTLFSALALGSLALGWNSAGVALPGLAAGPTADSGAAEKVLHGFGGGSDGSERGRVSLPVAALDALFDAYAHDGTVTMHMKTIVSIADARGA